MINHCSVHCCFVILILIQIVLFMLDLLKEFREKNISNRKREQLLSLLRSSVNSIDAGVRKHRTKIISQAANRLNLK